MKELMWVTHPLGLAIFLLGDSNGHTILIKYSVKLESDIFWLAPWLLQLKKVQINCLEKNCKSQADYQVVTTVTVLSTNVSSFLLSYMQWAIE